MSLSLHQINVIIGPNGCGKSNLYQSVYLLAEAANGRLAEALAREGGMPSALWAGVRTKGPVRLSLGACVDEFDYELALGLPAPSNSAFTLDPEVKEERICFKHRGKKTVDSLRRKGSSAHLRDMEGRMVTYPVMLRTQETALSQIREPHLYPELSELRSEMNCWRFYHHFPTDPSAPSRNPQVGVQTPVLSSDGRDLAAAIQTIFEIGNRTAANEAIDRMLPGAAVRVHVDDQCRMAVEVTVPWMQRPLRASELSDGTLRYLYLLAALLSPRPPSLIALNEPETSLHPEVIDPLARLLVEAAELSQLWVVTHSETLAARIQHYSGQRPILLKLQDGETRLVDQENS